MSLLIGNYCDVAQFLAYVELVAVFFFKILYIHFDDLGYELAEFIDWKFRLLRHAFLNL